MKKTITVGGFIVLNLLAVFSYSLEKPIISALVYGQVEFSRVWLAILFLFIVFVGSVSGAAFIIERWLSKSVEEIVEVDCE